MKINSDFLQFVFTTAAFGLILYLSQFFADEPASHFSQTQSPGNVDTRSGGLHVDTGRPSVKKTVGQDAANVIQASRGDVMY